MKKWPENWKIVEMPECYCWCLGITVASLVVIHAIGWMYLLRVTEAQYAHIKTQEKTIEELRLKVPVLRSVQDLDDGPLLLCGPDDNERSVF